MKKRLTQIAKENNIKFEELQKLAADKLSAQMMTGKGRNTWISDNGQQILDQAMEVPEGVAKHITAVIVRRAPNQRYLYAYSKDIDKVIPVLVPRRYAKNLMGKLVSVEVIEDVQGSSYRYRKS
tara:strand:+ start:258 stop:629 length:372 start_codon:yes stop_codon:yes gene_type:complete